MSIRTNLVAALLLACGATQALAGEECRPRRYAELDMTPIRGGAAFTVPVELSGKPYRMMLKPTPLSYLYDRYADAAGLARKDVAENKFIHINGQAITSYVRLPEMSVGGNTGHDLAILVMRPPRALADDIVGTLGTDILQSFDVELDFAARKMGLFAPDPCDGAGVYWSTAYTVLPMEKDRAGQLSVTMKLDGHDVKVMFDGVSSRSSMAYNLAVRDFGVAAPADAGGPENRNEETATRSDDTLNRADPRLHRFGRLEAGGLTILNPMVYLTGDAAAPLCDGKTRSRLGNFSRYTSTCYSGPQLTLGMPDVKKLHLLFAFKAGKLYLTAADAHP